MRPLIGSVDADAFAASMLGLAVERATANLPQTTNSPIYTITGGRVLVLFLMGEVTTAIQNQANNTKLTAVPSVGSSVDLCATVDVANLEVGGKLILPAAFATALAKTLAGAASYSYAGAVVATGTINLNCAASNTGQVKWTLFYVPIDSGAAVAAA